MRRLRYIKVWAFAAVLGPRASADDGIVDWLQQHARGLGLVSAATFVLALIVLPIVVGRLPADYFIRDQREPMRRESGHPLLWGALALLKNLLGVAFLVAGIAMLVLPGQGTLTILLGLGLTNFPGKFKLERRILSLPAVRAGLDLIRQKARQSPFSWHD